MTSQVSLVIEDVANGELLVISRQQQGIRLVDAFTGESSTFIDSNARLIAETILWMLGDADVRPDLTEIDEADVPTTPTLLHPVTDMQQRDK